MVLWYTAQIKIYCTSVRMSAGIPVDMSILQSNRNNPKKQARTILLGTLLYMLVKELGKL